MKSYDYILFDAYSFAVRFHKVDEEADFGDRFISFLIKTRNEYAPLSIPWVCWDMAGGSELRKKINPKYKANRGEYHQNFFTVKSRIIDCLGDYFHQAIPDEGEADDLIATMANKIRSVGKSALIVSNDKDLLQLTELGVDQLRSCEIFDHDRVKNEFIDILYYLAMIGDASDNISGVPGIGKSKALYALESITGIEKILSNDADAHRVEMYSVSKNCAAAQQKILQHRELFLEAIELIKLQYVGYSKIPSSGKTKEFIRKLEKNGYVDSYAALRLPTKSV